MLSGLPSVFHTTFFIHVPCLLGKLLQIPSELYCLWYLGYMYVFMAIPLLFQRQKMFIVCGALCPKLCHLPKEEPPFRGEGGGGRVEKPLTSLGARRVGTLLVTWFHR